MQHLHSVAQGPAQDALGLLGVVCQKRAHLAVALAPLVGEHGLDHAGPGCFPGKRRELLGVAHERHPRHRHAGPPGDAIRLLLVHQREMGAPRVLECAKVAGQAIGVLNQPLAAAVGAREHDALLGGLSDRQKRSEPAFPLRLEGCDDALHAPAVSDDRLALDGRHPCPEPGHPARQRQARVVRIDKHDMRPVHPGHARCPARRRPRTARSGCRPRRRQTW